jgi:hypothetical protein
MHPIWSNLAVFAVVAIYFLWRAYAQVQRRRRLRQRVAYMLWVAAQHCDAPGELAEVD